MVEAAAPFDFTLRSDEGAIHARLSRNGEHKVKTISSDDAVDWTAHACRLRLPGKVIALLRQIHL